MSHRPSAPLDRLFASLIGTALVFLLVWTLTNGGAR